jgi:glycosyltransferase involved in cell wall biosynthesis
MRALQLGFITAGTRGIATGSERYYWDLVRALPRQGVDVRGLVLGEIAPNADLADRVRSFAPEGGKALARLRSLRRAVAEDIAAVDVVASHHAQHALPVLDVLGSRPLVVHFHGPLVREGRAEGASVRRLAMRALAESLVYRRAARFIVLSQANARTLREAYRVDDARIRIVPGAVDLERFRPSASREAVRAALGWPRDRPIVLAVRRLAPTKGLENLLEAARLLRARVPDVLLAIAGAGPLEANLRALTQAYGLDDAVRFTGQLSATLPAAYAAADVSVVPSVALEGFGLSVVESLACGTPALVTPVTGLPEVVRDLDPRLVLAGSDPRSLADGLADALERPAALPAAAACRTYARRFDWNAIAARIRDVYREVA